MTWIISLIIIVLALRTTLWHLQCWQLREYRFDRMRAWLNTNDGKAFWIPWFKPGLLPRPKISGRIILILLILAVINLLLLTTTYYLLSNTHLTIILLLWERTLFLQIALSVYISQIPTNFKKQKLFQQAKKIVDQNPDIIRIGITGSYGKSSTKEILVPLLKDHFGTQNVLFNPANQNNETAIARLILKSTSFFKAVPLEKGKTGGLKVLVIEVGAYKQGEIKTVCQFIQPHISILTGLNQQHIELFGSQQKIGEAKFEIAQAASQKVFFNANNDLLVSLFEDKDITATKIPLHKNLIKNLNSSAQESNFKLYGADFQLPWPGQFFVENALLALECARELGVPTVALQNSLKNLPPLKRALSLEVHPQGFTVLRDTYSANADGVLQAIAHLKNFSGKKIFVGLPLRELGKEAKTVHQQIFTALKDINAEVFWTKSDFADLGKKTLGKKFHLQDIAQLEKIIKTLQKDDVVLLESKLPRKITSLL